MRRLRIVILLLLGAAAVFLLLIQLVPFGRSHTNPPVAREPEWESAQTEQPGVVWGDGGDEEGDD